MPLDPIYTHENTHAAYQLNWIVSAFPNAPLPAPNDWLVALQTATEPDGVRILEHRHNGGCEQFLVSSEPRVSPSATVRSVKGRLQYLLRNQFPKAFRGNYRIESLGSVKADVVDAYVSRQPERHPMADPRVQAMFESFQFHDPSVSLVDVRYSSHGQFLHSLHVVVEHVDGWRDVNETSLAATRNMLIKASKNSGWLLARAGIVADHIHLEVGCGVAEAPGDVAVQLMNNLAFAHGMKPIYKFGFYVGTIGRIDWGAVWNSPQWKRPTENESICVSQTSNHPDKPGGVSANQSVDTGSGQMLLHPGKPGGSEVSVGTSASASTTLGGRR